MTAEPFGETQGLSAGLAEPTAAIDDTTTFRSTGDGQSTADTAKAQARDVAAEGVEGGKHVASVARGQAKEVASEAGHQAKMLLDQARSELMTNATSAQSRVADQLHSLSHQLGSMASKSEQEGLASDLAAQASRQVGSVAHWLSERDPGSLMSELKDMARNKPGMFLAAAAGAGLVAGRMTRGVKAGPPDNNSQGNARGGMPLATGIAPTSTTWQPTAMPGPASASTPATAIPTPATAAPLFGTDDPGLGSPNPAARAGVHAEEDVLDEPYPPNKSGMSL